MAGNSGKMTNEALAARGPRMVLARVGRSLVIYREGQPCIRGPFSVLAKSYSLGYLRRVGKGNL
jgi:hypothetical protein